MIARLIIWSIKNRLLVLLICALLCVAGIYSMRTIPVDALPDLSDVQVIIRTNFAGQAPQIVEDQVTYPLSMAMLSVPGAVSVRGYSFFGDSYVYVIFSDKTDLYWARSRVLEYLNQVSDQLPAGVSPKLGPDATGVGWIYQYALKDTTGKHDLAQLRSLQDWFLKYELQSVPGVSEVATLGGMVKQYQVAIDPDRLRGYYLTLQNVKKAIQESSAETSGSVLEIAEAEYMVRFKGYVKNVEDIGLTSVPTSKRRLSISSLLLDDIAKTIQIGPAMRRGIADLNGEGEVVGGIIVMRSGENALSTINAVKEKIAQLRHSLPAGVELVETYDRSQLINRSINTLSYRLLEEFLVVVIVCALFLMHMRSSLVILLSLPIGILTAFIVMRLQGINANIMSLGGIAIAIGAMVDASIVMIENVHKHAERTDFQGANRIAAIQRAAIEVGPPLFFSLLIITLSFLPVFTLEAQEARLFTPLAYTKTWAMAAAAGLSITLVPALMVYLIRGKIRKEEDNPLNRWLVSIYRPLINKALVHPQFVIAAALLLIVSAVLPVMQLGSEFMPELDEGDFLYMPTTLPGLSVGKAREILQQTDRLIKTIPEVQMVFGKAGRAETATDPAPLTMLETVIQLKPRDQWREGMTMEKLKQALDQRVQIPSLTNAWLMPIRTRINMQSTGINTPLGIKISGDDLQQIEQLGKKVEAILSTVSGTKTVLSDRSAGARYIDVDIDRRSAAHYGLSIAEIQESASIAIGGLDVIYTIEGRERYPVNLRYPQDWRDSISKLKDLPMVVTEDTQIQLRDLADVRVVDGPPMIKSENGRLTGWVYITIDDNDIGRYVARAKEALNKNIQLPAGYTINWAGQYQYMQRAQQRLTYVIPLTLFIIWILLYISFRSISDSVMVMLAVPLALTGGFWLLWALGFNLSIAVAVGFIALAGVAAEFGVVMIIYLREAMQRHQPQNEEQLRQAVIDGAIMRVRPKAMTAAVIIVGLMPILLGSGAGSEVMKRIAAPMIGGMITAPLVSMLLIPVMYFVWSRNKLQLYK
ncbi:Cobalt-zinc-cadmium resistance protein CzcA; Cation efflux system protein CusA [hydrothermal vent metagenome]|uniref:Cobalt-zinc-cadmium resistance protein CzcA Cation efflux system protein CusA n=1 Tax=hydrothermal vent metagenome TaxID=652676 RepID=A0A3B0Y214_9ZZZZ